jgi:hypothetical protein
MGLIYSSAVHPRPCPGCGDDTKVRVFTSVKSAVEFGISGLCQKCQDKTFKESADDRA